MQKWLVGEIPLYVKIWPKPTHPLQKRRFLINYITLETLELFRLA